ncbi:MAG: hypothetical protein KDD06_21040 [Phaeodactylibacter sp.]|nr:hypothetical protein [Phaeodactylibacter sp.]MCB9265137.1 hypothetical protein [Lewinellaceae bacterium]MCB9289998.1 hypothetical protein [Lewinellaceae bacterium]
MSKKILQRSAILFALFSALLFFVLSSWAMAEYPGGTIHDRASVGYSFWYNYFSDLGRTRSWNGAPNELSSRLFEAGLLTVGISLGAYFLVLPTIFRKAEARFLAVVASALGLMAAMSYIGIALNPLNVNYRMHTIFVRAGFIAFLVMSLFYTLAILSEPGYPNHYARAFGLFSLLLGLQVVIMLFGPRAWTSPGALLLQASAQKVVVYAEMLCMVYQGVGAWRWISWSGQ